MEHIEMNVAENQMKNGKSGKKAKKGPNDAINARTTNGLTPLLLSLIKGNFESDETKQSLIRLAAMKYSSKCYLLDLENDI